MDMAGKTIGFGVTGSHCTYHEVYPQMQRLVAAGARVIPIVSGAVLGTSTRFGEAGEWAQRMRELTGETLVESIPQAEPLGPQRVLDCMLIAPCTGSSLSRFANAQNDSPVLMAAKATLRNQRPVVVAISTNDGLGLNAPNIATLLNAKHVYFVPFGQDDPEVKVNSLVANMELIIPTIAAALAGRQLQPLLIERQRASKGA
jgi:dipicolinate synthase subunit B